jgi:multidrug efflux pump subunit AcrB
MQSGLAGNIGKQFINSKLTPLLMIAFLVIGFYTATLTPREEEPQIDVPIADIFIGYPGASAAEVESRVVKPLEKILSNVPGVEYVYATASPGQAFVVMRYYVGEDVERSIVKTYNEIEKHMDQMPPGVTMPLVKTRSIDDVPVLGLTFWSDVYDDYQIRRIAQEVNNEIEKVDHVANTFISGGRSRQVNVMIDRDRLASYGLDMLTVARMVQMANQQMQSGSFKNADQAFVVESGDWLENAQDVRDLVVGVYQGSPIYLKQVANIADGASEPTTYVEFGYGLGNETEWKDKPGQYPAVTLAISKRKGADAMRVAEQILLKLDHLKSTLIPEEINVTITRNYGETASHKVSELIMHLLGAIIAVTIVVSLSMGWRGGLVVFLSVPVTFALTLFIYYMFGYTLNRITLFALVFVTGIVVDDSIIVAENMHRHFKMRKLPFFQAAIASLNEVGNPTILATFTVIAAVLPMAFVSGLMGPYMSPMPIGAAMAMIFSLLVALVITPFLAYRLLKAEKHKEEKPFILEETPIYRFYNAIIQPMLESRWKRWTFIGATTFLLLASMSLLYFKMVAVKMLPFDNKNEFQVVIDMPEGTTLERTAVVANEIAAFIREQPEVTHYQTYVGTASPINFNGLVRHYDLRMGQHMGDIQVNLLDKSKRSVQSHQIAKSLREPIQKIASVYDANVKIVEVPPGPPVVSTLVAEIYGPDFESQIAVAERVKQVFLQTEGVVDVDWYVEDDQTEYKVTVAKEKAMLHGVTTEQVVTALGMGLNGANISQLYQESDYEQVPIFIQLQEDQRTSMNDVLRMKIRSSSGQMVSMNDLVTIREQVQDKSIYHKNQKRVVYVTGEVAGRLESPVYAILDISEQLAELDLPKGMELTEYYTDEPFLENQFGLKWDGEWHITYEVFRDLGAAFAVVLVIIYMLITGWFQDFKVPVVMMVAIPLSLVGILVGHWIMGAFFTATSMIGMIALAGIMVRNSVLLIDFINLRMKDGISLKQATIEAGAVRTTPILLTAGTVVIGAIVILFDPIFQGLAISLMGGSIASTALTLLMVPLIYYMVEKKHHQEEVLPRSDLSEDTSEEKKEKTLIES